MDEYGFVALQLANRKQGMVRCHPRGGKYRRSIERHGFGDGVQMTGRHHTQFGVAAWRVYADNTKLAIEVASIA